MARWQMAAPGCQNVARNVLRIETMKRMLESRPFFRFSIEPRNSCRVVRQDTAQILILRVGDELDRVCGMAVQRVGRLHDQVDHPQSR
jgi:hypothetical protein